MLYYLMSFQLGFLYVSVYARAEWIVKWRAGGQIEFRGPQGDEPSHCMFRLGLDRLIR